MRDGTSNYFLNGARCRRKDITQLFLGTGLGSRSYAIIEQGMISRVIEAKADDMRAFVEEAAGISRYKERRKETEARISDTRENLERLQDVRDEVDKQIRHLQRQAATARRYQVLKETERRLTAELLALRLREIDSGAEVQDSAVRDCELTMQQALADQRAAEAAIETQRVYQTEQSERVSARAGPLLRNRRGDQPHRKSITHMRELRDQQRNELTQARATLAELNSHIDRDEREIAQLRAEIEKLTPDLAQAQVAEAHLNDALATAEHQLADWQQRWEDFNREQGAAHQTTQVERARIEQLENQLRRLVEPGRSPGRRTRSADGAGILRAAGAACREGIAGAQQRRRIVACVDRRARSIAPTARHAIRCGRQARKRAQRPRAPARGSGLARSACRKPHWVAAIRAPPNG